MSYKVVIKRGKGRIEPTLHEQLYVNTDKAAVNAKHVIRAPYPGLSVYTREFGYHLWRFSVLIGGMFLWGLFLTGDMTPILLRSMPGFSGYVNSTDYVGMEQIKVHGLRFIVTLAEQFVLVMIYMAYPDSKNKETNTTAYYMERVLDFCHGFTWVIFVCMTAVPYVRLSLRGVSAQEFDYKLLCQYTFGNINGSTFRELTHTLPANGTDFGYTTAVVLIITFALFLVHVAVQLLKVYGYGDEMPESWIVGAFRYLFGITRLEAGVEVPAYFASFMFVYSLSVGWFFSFDAIPAMANLSFGDLRQPCASDIAGLSSVAFGFAIGAMLLVRGIMSLILALINGDDLAKLPGDMCSFMLQLVAQSFPVIIATVNAMWLTYAFVPMLNELIFPGSDVSWPWYPRVTANNRASVGYLFLWTFLFNLFACFAFVVALRVRGEDTSMQSLYRRSDGITWEHEGALRGSNNLTMRFSVAYMWASFAAIQLASYLLAPIYPVALTFSAGQAPQLFVTLFVVTMIAGVAWLAMEFTTEACRGGK